MLAAMLMDRGAASAVYRALPRAVIEDAIGLVDGTAIDREPLMTDDARQTVLGGLCGLMEQDGDVGPNALSSYLEDRGRLDHAGGMASILAMMDDPILFAITQAPQHAKRVVMFWQRRQAARGLAEASDQALTGTDTAALAERVRRGVLDVLESGGGNELPECRRIDQIQPPPRDDPSELIRHRFMCGGSVHLWCGPSGVGKSSLVMQTAEHWALGWPAFGLEPTRPLRSVIINGENDWGDIGEMTAGVRAGMRLRPEHEQVLSGMVAVYAESGRTGDEFASMLGRILDRDKPDIAFIDPVFSYIDGAVKEQEAVSYFMRQLMIPLAQRTGVAIVIVHHTNKPSTGQEKGQWAAGDFAYLGSGSAEWANASRSVIALRSIGSHTVYQLMAAKRGGRLRWHDPDGNPVTERWIAHHREPGVICWRDADPYEIEDAQQEAMERSKGRGKAVRGGRPSKVSDSLLTLLARDSGGMPMAKFVDAVRATFEVGSKPCSRTVERAIASAADRGFLRNLGGIYATRS